MRSSPAFFMKPKNHKVILCVDDEAAGLSVRKAVLESQGYRVLTAANGRDALGIFSSEAVDLVVLDYAMPEMDGQAVAERMKQLRADVPIVMLSAYVNLPRETMALVDRCLTKGEPTPILLGTITNLLQDSDGGSTSMRRAH
jgi:CheY-like chemotaxis protein